MQNYPCPLVSAPATPPLSCPLDSVEGKASVERQTAFAFPSSQQQAAISELKDFDEDKILTWLTLLRSIEPGFHHHYVSGGLSSQQLSAISTLRDCLDSDILVWLQCLSLNGNVNRDRTLLSLGRSTSKASAVSSSRHTKRISTKSTLRSSISSLSPSTHSSNTSFSTPRSSLGYASSLPDLPEGIAENEDSGHIHWCPECDKQIKTCDGWKRHMKEHEKFYPCMPSGAVENTGDGPVCALCGIKDPDPSHVAEHRTSPCVSSTRGPTRKSRKSLLVEHLAIHSVYDAAASDLADRWQCIRNKRAFACGFCVQPFDNIKDQLNHIDNEHFKNLEDKSGWDISTVIRGLLHQPKVDRFWQQLLTIDSTLLECNFRWDAPAAESLQIKLEGGDQSGADLALMAFESSTCGNVRARQGVSTAITVPVLQRMASRQHLSSGDCSSTNSTSKPTSAPSRQIGHIVSRYQPGTPSWSDLDTAYSDPPASFFDPPRDQFADSGGLFKSDYHGIDYALQQAPILDGTGTFAQIRPSLYPLPSAQPPFSTDLQFDQHAHLQGHLDEAGELIAAHLTYPDYGQTSTYGAVNALEFPPEAHTTSHAHVSTSAMTVSSSSDSGSTARDGSNSREKPLPALPASHREMEKHVAESQPRSPMDLEFG